MIVGKEGRKREKMEGKKEGRKKEIDGDNT